MSADNRITPRSTERKLPSSVLNRNKGTLKGRPIVSRQRSKSDPTPLPAPREETRSRSKSFFGRLFAVGESKDQDPRPKHGYKSGLSLADSYANYGEVVPPVITQLIKRLRYVDAGRTEGLFRISAKAVDVNKLIKAFETGDYKVTDHCSEPHVLACALKQYLRENLADSVIDAAHKQVFLDAVERVDVHDQLAGLAAALKTLPEESYETLRAILTYCFEVRNQDNKMTATNVATCMAPNLIKGSTDPIQAVTEILRINQAIETMITHYAKLFC